MIRQPLIPSDNRHIVLIQVFRSLAVVLTFLLFLTLFLQRHIYNNDLWWHLATGKQIVAQGSLLQDDPFSYTTQKEQSARKAVIMKGYWLSQILMYRIYSLWGLAGIVVLRSLLMSCFLLLIFLAARRNKAPHLLSLFLTAAVFMVAKNFLGERPQLFTFACFSAILYMLEDFRLGGSRKIFLAPVLIALLSNIHPGYIICILLITSYFLGETVLGTVRKRQGGPDLKILAFVWAASMGTIFLNPNGLDIIGSVLFPGKQFEGIAEFTPTFTAYLRRTASPDYAYFFFLILSLFGLRQIKKEDTTHIILLALFTLLSFLALRYIIFYMCVAAPVLSGLLMRLAGKPVFGRSSELLRKSAAPLYALFAGIMTVLVAIQLPALAKSRFTEDTAFSVPKAAADFLHQNSLQGNIFNEYGFGGYLVWRLYPDKKVFIDGRALEPVAYEEYTAAVLAVPEGPLSWETTFAKYAVTAVVMPPLTPRGDLYPLAETLIDDNNWLLIYRDGLSLIFLKRQSGNELLEKRFSKNKEEAYQTIIIQAAARARQSRGNPSHLITLGRVFYKMGKTEDAEKAFLLALERDPGNPVIMEWLVRLKQQKHKGSSGL